MINFPNNFPFKITNTTGSTLCGISAGQTLTIGPTAINDTLTIYNNHAELTVSSLISGDLTATDIDDVLINGNTAAAVFSNVRADIIEYQNISATQQKNITVAEYVKLTPITTATRNTLHTTDGLQIFNSDTGNPEICKNGQWDGNVGVQGNQGVTGDSGPQGDDGAQGNQGVTGDSGPQGDDGAQGATGPISNVTGSNEVTSIEVVTTLPAVGSRVTGRLYFLVG